MIAPRRFVRFAGGRIGALPVDEIMFLSLDDLLGENGTCSPQPALAVDGLRGMQLGILGFLVVDGFLPLAQTSRIEIA